MRVRYRGAGEPHRERMRCRARSARPPDQEIVALTDQGVGRPLRRHAIRVQPVHPITGCQALRRPLRRPVRRARRCGVIIVIISTLTLQVRQVLFLTLSVLGKCKKYSIPKV
jgi:hypothetical protein